MARTTSTKAIERTEPATAGSVASTAATAHLPVVVVPGLGPRLGFRPDELASLLGVSKDLVDSWVDSGSAPLVGVPGKVRVIAAWWVAQAVLGQTETGAVTKPVRDSAAVTSAPVAPVTPRLQVVPSPTAPRRKGRAAKPKPAVAAAWEIPPTVGR